MAQVTLRRRGSRQPRHEEEPVVRVGQVCIVNGQIGVVKYYGPVHFDSGLHIGIEIKGSPLTGAHNGTLDGNHYFTAKPGTGIFVEKITRFT